MFNATDGDLTSGKPANIQVLNLNRPPQISLVFDTVYVNESDTARISASFGDPDNENIVANDDNLLLVSSSDIRFVLESLNANSTTFAWITGYDDAGIMLVNMTVTDGEYFATQTATVYIYNVNRPPVLNQVDDVYGYENSTINITLNATDPDGDLLIYTLNDSRFFGVGNEFSFYADFDQMGTYSLQATASDGMLSDYSIFNLFIFNVDREPVITSTPITSVYPYSPYTYQVEATDPDNDTLTYTLLLGSAGMAINSTTGLFEWVSEGIGSYWFP